MENKNKGTIILENIAHECKRLMVRRNLGVQSAHIFRKHNRVAKV